MDDHCRRPVDRMNDHCRRPSCRMEDHCRRPSYQKDDHCRRPFHRMDDHCRRPSYRLDVNYRRPSYRTLPFHCCVCIWSFSMVIFVFRQISHKNLFYNSIHIKRRGLTVVKFSLGANLQTRLDPTHGPQCPARPRWGNSSARRDCQHGHPDEKVMRRRQVPRRSRRVQSIIACGPNLHP